jgi:hypothetical protein
MFWLTRPCNGSIAGEMLARHAQDYLFVAGQSIGVGSFSEAKE